MHQASDINASEHSHGNFGQVNTVAVTEPKYPACWLATSDFWSAIPPEIADWIRTRLSRSNVFYKSVEEMRRHINRCAIRTVHAEILVNVLRSEAETIEIKNQACPHHVQYWTAWTFLEFQFAKLELGTTIEKLDGKYAVTDKHLWIHHQNKASTCLQMMQNKSESSYFMHLFFEGSLDQNLDHPCVWKKRRSNCHSDPRLRFIRYGFTQVVWYWLHSSWWSCHGQW